MGISVIKASLLHAHDMDDRPCTTRGRGRRMTVIMMRWTHSLVLLMVVLCNVSAEGNEATTSALMELFHATHGQNWTYAMNWGNGDPCPSAHWYGVECAEDEVNALYLSSNNLNGTIPSSLYSLSSLSVLDVANNELSGTVHHNIVQMSHLRELFLHRNSFHGALPDVSTMHELELLYMYDNNFEGELPTFPETVQVVDVHNNLINGTIPLLRNSTIIYLDVSNNELTGTLETTIFSNSHLQYILLQNNYFEGTIPSLDTVPRLHTLNVSRNKFSQLPNTLPASLRFFDASNNELEGTIRHGFVSLDQRLWEIDLSNNNLFGDFPLFMRIQSHAFVAKTNGNNLWCPSPEWCAADETCNECNEPPCCVPHFGGTCKSRPATECVHAAKPSCALYWNETCVSIVEHGDCGDPQDICVYDFQVGDDENDGAANTTLLLSLNITVALLLMLAVLVLPITAVFVWMRLRGSTRAVDFVKV